MGTKLPFSYTAAPALFQQGMDPAELGAKDLWEMTLKEKGSWEGFPGV